MKASSLRFTALAAVVAVFASPTVSARSRSAITPRLAVDTYSEGGYADSTSVPQGGQLTYRIASGLSPFTANVLNLANESLTLKTIPALQSTVRDCAGHSSDGCGWDVTGTLAIPPTWPSGYYAIKFPTTTGQRYLPFVVRQASPGLTANVLVVSSTNTFQAYNKFGGASSYSQPRADSVSFNRPYDLASGLGGYADWEDDFSAWMRQQGIAFEVATDSDLEDPMLLSHYRAVVLVGHSEFWTSNARKNLEAFSAGGGHIAILGGNTMWYQARLAGNGRTLVAYRDAARDPMASQNPQLTTGNWYAAPLLNPENLITGSSFRYGGYANRAGDPSTWSNDPRTFQMKPVSQRTGYTVLAASSWIFQGTNVHDGQAFGPAAAGLAVDGVVFNCDSNRNPAVADSSDGTPANFQLLAYTPATTGFGVVGWYVNSSGGAVFNAGSQEWPSALLTDSVVSRMTLNVLQRFAIGDRFTSPSSATTSRMSDMFNCRQSSFDVLPWWDGSAGTGAVSNRCAYEGASGLELIGPQEVSIARGFAPTSGLPRAFVRVYINADAFSGTTTDPIPLITLRSRADGVTRRFAQAELQYVNGKRRMRLAMLNTAGTALEGVTAWVDLAGGWQPVQITWQSPGNATFQVGSGAELNVSNGHGGQSATELELYYPPLASSSGYVCLDGITVSTEKLQSVMGLRGY